MQSEYDSTEWKLNSWKNKRISQQPIYQNEQLLNEQLNIVESYTDCISTFSQVNDLKKSLEDVHNDKAFVLISGDCCEPFSESDEFSVKMKCAFINCLAHIMNNKYGKQVISIGRIAGQYAKPRSNNSEIINQKEYYVYKGENINSIDINNRSPDPFS